jgi:hypothetical protein
MCHDTHAYLKAGLMYFSDLSFRSLTSTVCNSIWEVAHVLLQYLIHQTEAVESEVPSGDLEVRCRNLWLVHRVGLVMKSGNDLWNG